MWFEESERRQSQRRDEMRKRNKLVVQKKLPTRQKTVGSIMKK